MKTQLSLAALTAFAVAASAQSFVAGWDFAGENPSLSVGNPTADKSGTFINGFTAQPSDYIFYTESSNFANPGPNGAPFIIDGGQEGFVQTQDTSGGTQASLFNAHQALFDNGQTVGGAPQVGRTFQNSFDTTTGLNFRGPIDDSFFSIFVEGTEFANWEVTYSRTFLNDDYDEVNNWGWWNMAADVAGNNDGIIDANEVTNFATDDLSALTEDTYAQTTVTVPTSLNFSDFYLVYTINTTETETAALQNQGVAIDNIALYAVPEPAALSGLFGLAALLIARRRA